MTGGGTRLSVVVAAQGPSVAVPRCLEAIEAQRAEGVAEVILVDNSPDGTAGRVAEQRFPDVRVLRHTGDALVPDLWGAGVLASQGEIVALTTGEMVPTPGWAAALLRPYSDGLWAGVGGVILPAPDLAPPDAAVYWLRYHRYAARPPAGPVHDIPGDNGSYRRAALQPFEARIRRDGFWEYEINQALGAGGARLYSTPEAVVTYVGGEDVGQFARQRLTHGRRFGEQRMARTRGARRALLLAAWPLTPAAFLLRIVGGTAAAGGLTSLARSSPVLLGLLLAWSLGELRGYVAGLGRRPGAERGE